MRNIVHVNTHDTGGAAIAAFRFHQSMKAAGLNSVLAVQYKSRQDKDVICLKPTLRFRIWGLLARWFKKKWNPESFDKDYYFFNRSESARFLSASAFLMQLPYTPDVIIFYWISNFITCGDMAALSQNSGAKLYWYLMDFGPFTGGCHYAWTCSHFNTGCKSCPAILNDADKNLARKNFEQKQVALQRVDLTILTPTVEYLSFTKTSPLFKNQRATYFPISADTQQFAPASDVALAKSKLGISATLKTVLIAASNLNEKRKGFGLALQVLNKLKAMAPGLDLTLIVAGNITEETLAAFPFRCLSVGFLNADDRLIEIYQATDVFLCSTVEDAGPMMVNEALLCGVPVAGFRVGILKDVVVNGKTGFIAEKGDADNLALGLLDLVMLSQQQTQTVSSHCRTIALKYFDPADRIRELEALALD